MYTYWVTYSDILSNKFIGGRVYRHDCGILDAWNQLVAPRIQNYYMGKGKSWYMYTSIE